MAMPQLHEASLKILASDYISVEVPSLSISINTLGRHIHLRPLSMQDKPKHFMEAPSKNDQNYCDLDDGQGSASYL